VLFLVVAFGAVWKTGHFTHPLDVTPSVEASVLPAPESPRVPVPEATTVREEIGAAQGQRGPEAFAEVPTADQAASPAEVVTIVEKGTTLRHLSLLYLQRYDLPTLARLCAFNHISEPNQIQIGQTIYIPLSLRRSVGSSQDPSAQTASVQARETRP
jgi:hypothetical protein